VEPGDVPLVKAYPGFTLHWPQNSPVRAEVSKPLVTANNIRSG